MPLDEPRAANLANWNDRVPLHVGAEGYPIEELVSDPRGLSRAVAFERGYLGDVSGLSLLHPQCHIGLDTLSWARLGARVTGIDFSPPALEFARALAARMELDARFVECELHDAPERLPEEFDVVVTGVGALNWLPSVRDWARIMAGFVRPGGRFFVREGHPVLTALDQDRSDGLLVLSESYFERAEPRRWVESETYAGRGEVDHATIYEWNHGLAETIDALLRAGLRIERVEEHRTLDWKALPQMIETPEGFVLPPEQRDLVPLMFSILATKPA